MRSHPPVGKAPAVRRRLAAVSLVLAAAGGLLGGGSAAAARSPVALRVVGGSPVASITSFPFQVSLFIQSPVGAFGQPASLAFCGGVVIDPTQLVTAAHCVTSESTGIPVNPATITALAGTATLPAAVPTAPAAASIAIDSHYDPQTADYDVAVVTLAAPLYTGAPHPDGTATLAPLPLITPALAARFANPDASPPEPVVISGLGQTAPVPVGSTDSASALPGQLQATQTHLVTDATCAAQYRALGSFGVPAITPRMLCAGEPAGGVDACSGDSGGPMVVDVNTPSTPPSDYVLAGLIDFGAGCAQPGYPGVYVRIATPEITSFIAQQAQLAGQQLLPAPTPVGAAPTRVVVGSGGTASLASSTGRVRQRMAHAAVRCLTATCTGTLTLRTTTTVGVAHFTIAADSTADVSVRITPRGQQQLDRHRRRLRTRATLRTTGTAGRQRNFTLTE